MHSGKYKSFGMAREDSKNMEGAGSGAKKAGRQVLLHKGCLEFILWIGEASENFSTGKRTQLDLCFRMIIPSQNREG